MKYCDKKYFKYSHTGVKEKVSDFGTSPNGFNRDVLRKCLSVFKIWDVINKKLNEKAIHSIHFITLAAICW